MNVGNRKMCLIMSAAGITQPTRSAGILVIKHQIKVSPPHPPAFESRVFYRLTLPTFQPGVFGAGVMGALVVQG